ncbi:UvrD-helicase domain-containing protein [Catenulispora rubra]|uniref:UvrD-helicase domain-containing protein n=1 Tax=Catenulispora rubra TaxID=280293 RepID=UPI002B26DEB6|nr:UvrD-helicase domain-containing protein [Catenulispora rubra]
MSISEKLPALTGQQRDAAFLKPDGHCVVLGTAGSGKTTMALHRADFLAAAPGVGGPTLLVTFNSTLATYLRSVCEGQPNLTIEKYHKFALGYLKSRGEVNIRIFKRREESMALALEDLRASGRHQRAVIDRPVEFFEDEIHWMVGHGVTARDDYLAGAPRIGRGRPLARADREVVFEVFQSYMRLRAQRGYRYDWDNLASHVLAHLGHDNTRRRYRHIVVDEGQDFTPQMIRTLAAAIPHEGSLTFFGDYAQQIYGSRMSWRSLGLNISDGVVRFEHNHRNSPQIAALAKAMADMPHFRDEVDVVPPVAVAANGPKPTVVRLEEPDRQLFAAAAIANGRAAARRVGILVRTRAAVHALAPHLDQRHRLYRLDKDLESWPMGPGIFYGTYHSGKGLEFDDVILPQCDADELPRPSEAEVHGMDEAMARESRQLYVAVTRAKKELVILHGGKLTSLMPPESSDLFTIATVNLVNL